jgi:hypothetical protein
MRLLPFDLLERPDRLDDLGIVRKPACCVFRENELAIGQNVEHATFSFDELGVEAKVPRECSSQTGSSREIVSTDAVLDGYFHDSCRWFGRSEDRKFGSSEASYTMIA